MLSWICIELSHLNNSLLLQKSRYSRAHYGNSYHWSRFGFLMSPVQEWKANPIWKIVVWLDRGSNTIAFDRGSRNRLRMFIIEKITVYTSEDKLKKVSLSQFSTLPVTLKLVPCMTTTRGQSKSVAEKFWFKIKYLKSPYAFLFLQSVYLLNFENELI
jgi:hypothetical protein